MLREAIEVIQQRVSLRGVDFDGVRLLGLPVRAEDDDGFGFDGVEDLVAEFAELRIHWVGGVVHYVGTAMGEEVDRGSRHGCCGWGVADVKELSRRSEESRMIESRDEYARPDNGC